MKIALNTLLATVLLAMPVPASADDKPPHVFGPPPTWEQFRKLAEADIARRLIDPESARITWLGGYHKGEYKPFLASRVSGYVSCGTVNARNRMGGYAGAVSFAVVIDHDRVLYAELDSRAGGMIADQCAKAVREGLLPPVPTSGTADIEAAPASTSTGVAAAASANGLTLRPMPDGAYVGAVAPASPAAAAGLRPGMVIASVNAIPLAGMGDAMLKVVDAAGATASLSIVGGMAVTLGGKP